MAGLDKPYVVADNCELCSVRMYEDVVVGGRPGALTLEGDPPAEALRQAQTAIALEFAELSGNEEFASGNQLVRIIYFYRSRLLLIGLALELIALGEEADAEQSLEESDLCRRRGEELSRWQARLTSRMQLTKVKLAEQIKKYDAQAAGNRGETQAIPSDYFTSQLVELGRHMGYRLTKDISMAEFAACIRSFKKEIEHAKHRLGSR